VGELMSLTANLTVRIAELRAMASGDNRNQQLNQRGFCNSEFFP
jgi:hypothetical protein